MIINTKLLSHSLIVNVVMVIVHPPKDVLSNSYCSQEHDVLSSNSSYIFGYTEYVKMSDFTIALD